MSVYYLIGSPTASTTTQGTAPSPTNPVPIAQPGAQVIEPKGPNNAPNIATQTQWFQLVASATSGNVTAVATLYFSNDAVNWTSYATTLNPAAATSVTFGLQTAIPCRYFAASMTTLTGTGAKAALTMSA